MKGGGTQSGNAWLAGLPALTKKIKKSFNKKMTLNFGTKLFDLEHETNLQSLTHTSLDIENFDYHVSNFTCFYNHFLYTD